MVGSSCSPSQIIPRRMFALLLFLGYFVQDKISLGETGCLVPFLCFSMSMVKCTETAKCYQFRFCLFLIYEKKILLCVNYIVI